MLADNGFIRLWKSARERSGNGTSCRKCLQSVPAEVDEPSGALTPTLQHHAYILTLTKLVKWKFPPHVLPGNQGRTDLQFPRLYPR